MERLIESELLKVSKAAAILDVDIGTIYKWIDRGILPAVKIGRTVRIDSEELRRLIKGLSPASPIDATVGTEKQERADERRTGRGDADGDDMDTANRTTPRR